MSRYIDEDLVNLKLKQICDERNTSYGVQFGGRAKDFAQLTDDIPTSDVVEVVRCKDCMWWEKGNDSLQGRCILHQSYPTGGWYCANGERKE